MEKNGSHTLNCGHTVCWRYGERSWESVEMTSKFRVVPVVMGTYALLILAALNGVL